MTGRERVALAQAYAVLRVLAETAITPSQKKVATRGAGHCLWGLGLDRHESFEAVEPEGETIDHIGALPSI